MTECHLSGASSCWPGAAASISPTAKTWSDFSPATAMPRRACAPRSRRFRHPRCAPGARVSARRHSSDRAAGCSRSRSRPRRCCALGCGGSMPPVCASRCAIIGPAGTSAAALQFEAPEGRVAIHPDALILALGGASWPRLGSDGGWADILAKSRHRRLAAAAGELRLPRELVGRVPRPLRRPAAEGPRTVVRRAVGAWRSHRDPRRPRRRRHLRAVGATARGHRCQRRGYARTSRCAPTSPPPNCSASSKPRAASNRWRTCCARR